MGKFIKDDEIWDIESMFEWFSDTIHVSDDFILYNFLSYQCLSHLIHKEILKLVEYVLIVVNGFDPLKKYWVYYYFSGYLGQSL
jgi:hypothetical protein